LQVSTVLQDQGTQNLSMFTDHFHYHISELRDFCIPDGIHVANEIDAGSYGFTATQQHENQQPFN
jgi:hypothetical protein